MTTSHEIEDKRRLPSDGLLAQLGSYGGAGARVVELSKGETSPAAVAPGMVTIGVHRSGPLPLVNLTVFDILLSTQRDAPAPWCGLARRRWMKRLRPSAPGSGSNR